MAMGIFEQLAWLTKRVKKLCCAIKVGAYQSPPPIDVANTPAFPDGYPMTEGGVYQFYGSSTTGTTNLFFTNPTSAGQILTIMNTSGSESLQLVDAPGSSRPYYSSGSTIPDNIAPGDTWQFVSVDGSILTMTPNYGFVWVGYRVYPNAI
jgi:hypothetical protein